MTSTCKRPSCRRHKTPASFSLNTDGTFAYQPQRDFLGSDSFTYVATDGSNQSLPGNRVHRSCPASRSRRLDGLLQKSGARRVGLPGNLRHTITVTNAGPSDATNVVVRVNRDGEDITLDIPSLAEGESTDLEVVYNVDATARSSTITTTVSGFEIDQPLANPDDDMAQESTTVVSAADVATTRVDPQPVWIASRACSFRACESRITISPRFLGFEFGSSRSLPHVTAYNAAAEQKEARLCRRRWFTRRRRFGRTEPSILQPGS